MLPKAAVADQENPELPGEASHGGFFHGERIPVQAPGCTSFPSLPDTVNSEGLADSSGPPEVSPCDCPHHLQSAVPSPGPGP